PLLTMFFSYCSVDHPDLHSFPTRRSSDLQSILRGVSKLPAAHVAVFDARGLRLRRYWEIPVSADRAPPDAAQQLVALLDLAVAKDRKSTRLNSSHVKISYAVFCLKKKKQR